MESLGDYRQVLGKKVHVLLAESSTASLRHWKQLLEIHSYEVTAVGSGLAALEVLAHNKKKVDLLLADVDLPDLNGFSLPQDAIKLGLPTILMTHREDFVTQKKALEDGICFCIGKPLEGKEVKSLWQYVLKGSLSKENHGIKIGSGKRLRTENGKSVYESAESSKSKRKSRRPSMKWTEELHSKFIAAIEKLGAGAKLPAKKIHELMGVPDLERIQVISHLQTYKNNLKKSLCEDRSGSSSRDMQPSRSNKTAGTASHDVLPGTEEANMINFSNTTSNPPIPMPGIAKTGVLGLGHTQVASRHQMCQYGAWRSVGKAQVPPTTVYADGRTKSTSMPHLVSSTSVRQLSDDQERRGRNNHTSATTVSSPSSLNVGRYDLIQTNPDSNAYNGMVGNVGEGNNNVTQGSSTATPSSLNLTHVPLPSVPGSFNSGANDRQTTHVLGLRHTQVASDFQNCHYGERRSVGKPLAPPLVSAENGKKTTSIPHFSSSATDHQLSDNQETRQRNTAVQGCRNVIPGTSIATPSSLPFSSAPHHAMSGSNGLRPSSSDQVPVENTSSDFAIDEDLQFLLDPNCQVNLEEIFANQQHFGSHKSETFTGGAVIINAQPYA